MDSNVYMGGSNSNPHHAPSLFCAAGCGFFGTAEKGSLCSKCYTDHRKETTAITQATTTALDELKIDDDDNYNSKDIYGQLPGTAPTIPRMFPNMQPLAGRQIESQVRELMESFGPLRVFDLVKDRETGNSKGYAFCVYQDLSVTDIACAALNGIKMGDKTLTVRRANHGTTQPKHEQESVLLHAQRQIALQKLMLAQPATSIAPATATKVVCLKNVVTPDELMDDDDYEDILEDMRTECGKFGTLVNVIIPRPQSDGEHGPGVGKVYLEYADTESAAKAKQGLHGRKFGGNEVLAVFYPENKLF